jgi:hypothetical protein
MLCLLPDRVPIFPLTVEARALDTIPPLLNIANVIPPQLTVLELPVFVTGERDMLTAPLLTANIFLLRMLLLPN